MNPIHKSVLVIDDSDDIQGLLMLLLESKGYVIECKSNGEDALNFLNSCAYLPDVILLDLKMPIMDGCDFLKHKESIPKLKNIPTIVMTADKPPEFVQTTVDVLLKPLNIKSVLTALEQNTSNSHPSRLSTTYSS